MLVRCVRRFRDIKADVLREEGDAFDVTQERLKEINSAGYGQLVEKVEKRPSEAATGPQEATSDEAKPAPRRRGRPRKTTTE